MPGAIPYHEQSRRQQQYHNQMYNAAPHSPIHANGYAYHHTPPPFYPHQPSPQAYARWHQMYAPSSYGHIPQVPQPQHIPHYPPRSPLVVSSHPYSPAANTHAAASFPRPATMHASHSQQNIPQAHKSSAPQALHTSVNGQVGLPSPAPTPPAREETPSSDMNAQEEPQDAAAAAQEIERIDTPSERAPVVAINPLLLPPQTRTPYYPRVRTMMRNWKDRE